MTLAFLKLTYSETQWLDRRGGRTIDDVFIDDDGLKYVYMGAGDGTDMKVYIPKELEITNEQI